jgi:hypothetical protein
MPTPALVFSLSWFVPFRKGLIILVPLLVLSPGRLHPVAECEAPSLVFVLLLGFA